MKMKLLFIIIITIGVAVVSLNPNVPTNLFSFLDIGTHHTSPYQIEVHKDHVVGQTFMPNFDDLFRISIFIPTQNLQKPYTLVFHLRQHGDSQDLVTKQWEFEQIKPPRNDFYTIPPDVEKTEKGFHFHIQFPTLHEVKNKTYYMYFEVPNAPPGKGIQLGLWKSWKRTKYYEALRKGSLFKDHKASLGHLAFRTFHTYSPKGANILQTIKLKLLRDKTFLIVYIILWMSLLLFLLSAKKRLTLGPLKKSNK